ncbi:MAG: EF-P beta-lysylation protein EpmB [Kistimonas sp.]|nr:EF-P beta-lysylation protein EpmB [Kistimonas sp.]
MITRSDQPVQQDRLSVFQFEEEPSWQQVLRQAVTCPRELLSLLELPCELAEGARAGARLFPLRVPRPYIARIEKGNRQDPLLLQVLPVQDEQTETPGFVPDPLGEQASNSQRGIVHKYHGRLLLLPGQACAINCRFCFRRHFPYEDNTLDSAQWAAALDYIRQDSSVREVILSGGDPLVQNDRRLAWIVTQLAAIGHVERVRVHSRLPVTVPQRVTPALVSALTDSRLQAVLVVHCNHPRELCQRVCDAMRELVEAGVTVLNQSTLLRGVNDDAAVLVELSEALFRCRILPYYLHLLDRVSGTAHFEVDETRARQLLGTMSSRCSGFLVPRLAREEQGAPCKSVLPPLYPDPD